MSHNRATDTQPTIRNTWQNNHIMGHLHIKLTEGWKTPPKCWINVSSIPIIIPILNYYIIMADAQIGGGIHGKTCYYSIQVLIFKTSSTISVMHESEKQIYKYIYTDQQKHHKKTLLTRITSLELQFWRFHSHLIITVWFFS